MGAIDELKALEMEKELEGLDYRKILLWLLSHGHGVELDCIPDEVDGHLVIKGGILMSSVHADSPFIYRTGIWESARFNVGGRWRHSTAPEPVEIVPQEVEPAPEPVNVVHQVDDPIHAGSIVGEQAVSMDDYRGMS